jgi:hypothetical protein
VRNKHSKYEAVASRVRKTHSTIRPIVCQYRSWEVTNVRLSHVTCLLGSAVVRPVKRQYALSNFPVDHIVIVVNTPSVLSTLIHISLHNPKDLHVSASAPVNNHDLHSLTLPKSRFVRHDLLVSVLCGQGSEELPARLLILESH